MGELTPRTTDHVAAFGELLSSKIINAAFSAQAMDSTLVDSRECIVTDNTHTRATPLFEESNKRLDSKLAPLLAAGRVPVMAVYRFHEGNYTTIVEAVRFFCCQGGAGCRAHRNMDRRGRMMTTDPNVSGAADQSH